jgi:hypothetical protein
MRHARAGRRPAESLRAAVKKMSGPDWVRHAVRLHAWGALPVGCKAARFRPQGWLGLVGEGEPWQDTRRTARLAVDKFDLGDGCWFGFFTGFVMSRIRQVPIVRSLLVSESAGPGLGLDPRGVERALPPLDSGYSLCCHPTPLPGRGAQCATCDADNAAQMRADDRGGPSGASQSSGRPGRGHAVKKVFEATRPVRKARSGG